MRGDGFTIGLARIAEAILVPPPKDWIKAAETHAKKMREQK